MQKQQLHFYTITVNYLREIKKAISFTIALKQQKYLGINLTKEVKNLYTKNCKNLIKEIDEEANKWKYIPCFWIRRIILIKMSIISKAIYRLYAISIKIPTACFTEMGKPLS